MSILLGYAMRDPVFSSGRQFAVFAAFISDVSTPHEATTPRACSAAAGSNPIPFPEQLNSAGRKPGKPRRFAVSLSRIRNFFPVNAQAELCQEES
jgi:hypothetical protein